MSDSSGSTWNTSWPGGAGQDVAEPIRPFSENELVGVRLFWTLYNEQYEAIREALLRDLSLDLEVGSVIRRIPVEQREQQARIGREATRGAVERGEWQGYLDYLRTQGTAYAEMGLSFGAWFRIVSAFRPHMTRHLIGAYGGETSQLMRALDGMDRFLDLALSTIGDAYLTRQSEVIARQREAMGELRVRSRYQTILASLLEGVVTTDPFGNVMP
jgi:hypothetical protein